MVIIHDKNGKTDVPALNFIQKINTDLPILYISRVSDYVFNEEIISLAGKKYILICFCEYGWDWDQSATHRWGYNTQSFDNIFSGEEWKKLDDFIKENEPELTFKRELLKKDVLHRQLPIEYPNWQPQQPLQTKEEFNSRPISSFLYWGRSHEARLMLHGEIWKNAARKGYDVCDNIYYFNGFMANEKNPNKWVTLNIPYYGRIDISELLKINSLSKTSISMPGAGKKCFRSTGESIINSVAVMEEDGLAYTYLFEHKVNCIKFNTTGNGINPEWGIISVIEEQLQNPDLYDIYVNSLRMADMYSVENYVHYLEEKIKEICRTLK